MRKFIVEVPATSANLGPGFDSLGLALDLWNEVHFTPISEGFKILIEGEGQESLPRDNSNLIIRAFEHLMTKAGKDILPGVEITCYNNIPLQSGLGSSASAVLVGLVGANTMLGNRFGERELIEIGAELEGHADNLSAALLGGLTIFAGGDQQAVVKKIELPPITVTVILPEVDLATSEARNVLPDSIPLSDAVYNISRTALVVEALREGDMDLLCQVIGDRLHQPQRLKLIPGAADALKAANENGIPAVLSGAGPSILVFSPDPPKSIQAAFNNAEVHCRQFSLAVSNSGVKISVD